MFFLTLRLPVTGPNARRCASHPLQSVACSTCHVVLAYGNARGSSSFCRARSHVCACVCLQYTADNPSQASQICRWSCTSASPFPSPLPFGAGCPRKTAWGKCKHGLHSLMSVKPSYISQRFSAGWEGQDTTHTGRRCLREMLNTDLTFKTSDASQHAAIASERYFKSPAWAGRSGRGWRLHSLTRGKNRQSRS